MGRTFNNTTAMIAAFSLSLPTVLPAQQLVATCDDETIGLTADMVADLGLELSTEQAAALEGAQVSEDIVIGAVDGAPALCLATTDLRELGASDDQIAALAGEAPEVAGQKEAEASQANAESEGAAGDVEAETAESTAEVGAEVESAAEEEVADAKSETARSEDEAGAQAKVAGSSETTAEVAVESDETTEAAAPDANAETEDRPAQAEADAAIEDTAAAAEAATEDIAAEVEPESEDTTIESDAETAGATAELTQELQATAEEIEAQSAEETDPNRQAEIAEQEAPEMSAAAREDAEAAEVEEVEVSEDDARSSSEEFSAETATTSSAVGDDDGLSDFEKALLVGLGAVVVGQALGDDSDARVVSKSQDRVVVLQDGRYRVLRDDNELIERPGSTVRRETFEDGSTRTVVIRENGVQVVTIRDPELRILRRVRIAPDGTRTVLIDDTTDVEPVEVATLPAPVDGLNLRADADVDELRAALDRVNRADRRFALYQVRNIEAVRKLAPAIQLEAINFRTGSAVIDPQEAEELSQLGNLIADYIDENPNEVFLIEGHTDAVGNAAMNLALSDRRAESVALALTEYFDVPPENLVVQGYGESDLEVLTLDAERANRRAAVRRITPLLTASR